MPKLLFIIFLVGVLFLPGYAGTPSPHRLLVHFIDVGQGSAVLIQLGGKNILYDCGDTGKGKVVFDYLKDQDIKHIDVLIASHAHKDHIGGCNYILQKMIVKEVYDNGSPSETGTHKKFIALTKQKAKYQIVEKDFKKYRLEFLVAYDTKEKLSEADRSIIVKLVHDQVSFLFTGDCEKACEEELLKDANLDVDMLLVGHHGSNDSSTHDFLRAVSPEIAVIQAGENNPHKHPRPEVLERLKKAGHNPGILDGQMGAGTTAAVKRFQVANSLPANGEIDIPTLTKILEQSLRP